VDVVKADPAECPALAPHFASGSPGATKCPIGVILSAYWCLWRRQFGCNGSECPGYYGTIPPDQSGSTKAADCVAVERVRREPVSGPNSLLTGKNTGNFTRFGGSNRALSRRNPYPERLSSPPPCRPKILRSTAALPRPISDPSRRLDCEIAIHMERSPTTNL
jgi:hypothetical protein